MKFYDSILTGLRQFFGKPGATEAELDNIISEQKQTLPEILSNAGVDTLTAQVNEMTKRLNGFQSNLDALTAQLADRDTTIQSMADQITASQTEINARDESIAALNAQIENANRSHAAQVASLSASIASLKAGVGIPKQEDMPVVLPKEAEQTQNQVKPLTNSRLAGFIGLPQKSN